MKKRYLVLTALLALSLAACSQEKVKNEDGAAKTEQTAKADGTVGNKSQEATQKKAEVVNKGDYYSIQGKYDEIIVANKHYPLSKDYNPGENPTAKAELVKLIKAMQEAGFPISDQYSGFRSYETQTKLYQDYVNKDGKAAADRYSARPGYSEHQTGLAFDVIGTNGDLVPEEKAAQWLLDHAADYGFVVRYLKGKEKETGYMAEEWHLRYVGKEAKEIQIIAPLSGEIVNIEDVPDVVFSEKIVGDGVAIRPAGDTIVAPVNGTIGKIFETNHAFSIESEDGVELFVHFGIDTVELKGEGFTRIAEEGQTVKVGEPIIKFDLATLEEKEKED